MVRQRQARHPLELAWPPFPEEASQTAGGDNGLMALRDWVEAEADFPALIWRGSGRPPLPEVLVMAPPLAEVHNGRDQAGEGAAAFEGGEESLMPDRRWWRRRASVAPLLGGCNLAVCDGRCVKGSTLGVGRRRRRVRGILLALALFVWEAGGWEPSHIQFR